MIKRRSHIHKPITSSLPASALSFSWIPLTLILLLYTSGLCTGDTGKADDLDKDKAKALVDSLLNNYTSPKSNYTKTGNPQIDWEFDPNLPRELNGRNLSDYPFLSRAPPAETINFTCDGLKDGFYASIEYKCQVYHHCLFGTRYDFLCGNYTAFDQKTFICQFVSEVDCPNSALFFAKNDDLYWTTTEAPPKPRQSGKRLRPAVQTYFPRPSSGKNTGDEETPKPQEYNTEYRRQNQPKVDSSSNYNSEYRRQNQPEIYGKSQDEESEEEYAPDPPRRRKPPRGRRRCKKGRCRGRNRPRARPRPAYYDYDDEYDDEDDYDDYENEYYDERPNKRRRDKPRLGGGRKVASSKKVESLTSTEKSLPLEVSSSAVVSTTEAPIALQEVSEIPLEPLDPEVEVGGKTREEIFTKSRPPPRIRPPVPRNERNKYNAIQGRAPTQSSTSTTAATEAPPAAAKAGEYDEYYDDDYQQQSTAKPKVTSTSKPKPTTPAAPTTLSSRQKFVNRNLRPATPGSTTPSTTTTSLRTTPSTTTTTKVTTPKTSATTTITTTTTTEAPQYDYEYEYEDELPPSSSSSTERSSTAASTTTTTTTTTTQKPSRNNYRGNKRPSAVSSVQTSTSVTVNEQDQDQDNAQQPLEPAEAPDASQNAINRRRSSWTRNQSSKSQAASETTPNSISSTTSERFQTKSIQRSPQQTYQEPVITVKSAPPQSQQQQSRTTEQPTSRIRPSRFWQRPSKVVASTVLPITTRFTTTEAPIDYADYQDEPETASVPATRYNSQKTGSSSSSSVAYRSPQISGNSEDAYSQQPQYARTGHQYTSSSSNINNNNNNNNQFLRQSQTPYRSPPAQTPARVTIDPSNYVSPYQSVDMTSSMRPEFISLLRDDEGSYYDDPPVLPQTPRNSYSSSSSSSTRRLPPQRPQYFGNQPYHQTQKNLYSAAQESYPTFVNPPPRFNPNGFMNMNNNNFRYPMMFHGGP